VSTKGKIIFAAANFRNSSAQFLKPAWCSNFSKLPDSLVNIYFYCSLLETVLWECLFTAHVVLDLDYS